MAFEEAFQQAFGGRSTHQSLPPPSPLSWLSKLLAADLLLGGETGRDKEDKSDGPANTNTADGGKVTLAAGNETPSKTPAEAPPLFCFPPWEPGPARRNQDNDAFDSCLVHPGRCLQGANKNQS
jgi:hypothetical protein